MLIDRYILKNHALPFIFAVFTLMSVFLLQFLMKFADRLVGKGLGFWVILKLISYNLAWMVVLVVPMAVLVSTLMAFGNMAQNNEVAVLKSSGVSLYRMMVAPFIASLIISYGLMQFNNYVYPNANHAARILLQDISKKKPTLSLVPGVFSNEIKNHSILAKEVDPNSNRLKFLTIYDYSDPQRLNIITANSGNIYFSKDQRKLIMDLFEGEIHQTDRMQKEAYRKMIFKKHRLVMEADNFAFQQSTFNQRRGDRELGAPEMMAIVDSLQKIREKLKKNFDGDLTKLFAWEKRALNSEFRRKLADTSLAYIRVQNQLNMVKSSITSDLTSLAFNKREINRFLVEIHKKYALPVACIVFILIGAPLGTMTRKGGLGMAAAVSLIFFLVYWAFLIGGEKLSDRGLLSPFWGIWSANILLGFLGVVFTIRAAKERIALNFDFIQKVIPKSWKNGSEEN